MSQSLLTLHALRTYFRQRPYSPEVTVDDAAQIWRGDKLYAGENPEDFMTAWALRDLVAEAFTGEPATMGRQVVEALAEAAGVEGGAGRYERLLHDLAPDVPRFLGAMWRSLYGERDIWPEHTLRRANGHS